MQASPSRQKSVNARVLGIDRDLSSSSQARGLHASERAAGSVTANDQQELDHLNRQQENDWYISLDFEPFGLK